MLDPKQFLTFPRIISAPVSTHCPAHCPIFTLPALFHDRNHLERSFAGAQLTSGSLCIPGLLSRQHPLPRILQQEANPLSSRKGSDSGCSPRKSISGRITHTPSILQEALLLNLKLLCHLYFLNLKLLYHLYFQLSACISLLLPCKDWPAPLKAGISQALP